MARVDDPAAARPPVPLGANRDYRIWWLGSALSALGTSLSTTAFPLLVLGSTGSALKAGSIGAASMVGAVVTMLVGGTLADRFSRRAILLVCPVVQAVALGVVAALVYAGSPSVVALDAAALGSGLAAGLQYAATTPALRRIVPREQFGEATARGLGSTMAARLAGAPLGGLLFGLFRWIPFLADAVSFLVVAAATALLRTPLGPDAVEGERRAGFVTELRAGWRVVRTNSYLRLNIVWTALLNAVTQGFVLLLVALVLYRGGSPAVVGVVNAMALAGGVLGAFASSLLLRRFRAKQVLFGALWVFVIALAPIAWLPVPWQIGVFLLIAMTMTVPLNSVLEAYEVRMVPDSHSGRVTAATRLGSQALQWAGPLAAGLLADGLGAPGAILVLTAVMAALAIALGFFRTTLSVLDRPLAEVEEIAVPADPGDAPEAIPATEAPEPADGAQLTPPVRRTTRS
ncbi:MFS transporter [Streptomyces sp. MN03-5084-2B]|nr:MFS transporter [Streptomyces sp. MN03-5084-2B]